MYIKRVSGKWKDDVGITNDYGAGLIYRIMHPHGNIQVADDNIYVLRMHRLCRPISNSCIQLSNSILYSKQVEAYHGRQLQGIKI